MGRNLKDYTNKKAGHLTAMRFSKRDNGYTFWVFKCKCGNEKELRIDNVFSNKIKTISCGCVSHLNYNTGKVKGSRFDVDVLMLSNISESILIDSCIKTTVRNYRQNAIKRGYRFELAFEDVKRIIFKNCFYCGTEPTEVSSKIKGYIFKRNGIDRTNNDTGYTKDNCVTCCKTCNYAKREKSQSDFYKWIERLIIHNTQRES